MVLQEVVPVDIETTEYRIKYPEKISPVPAPRLTRDSSSSWTSRKSRSSKKSRRSISNVSPRDKRVVVSLTNSRSSTTEIKSSRRRTISITSESEILQILETKNTHSSSSSDFPSRSEQSSTSNQKIAEKFSVTSASKIPIPYSSQTSPYHHVDDVQEFRVVGDQAIRDTTDYDSSETVEEKPAKQSTSRETRDTVKEWVHNPVNANTVEKAVSSASTFSSSSSSIDQAQDEISLTQSSIYNENVSKSSYSVRSLRKANAYFRFFKKKFVFAQKRASFLRNLFYDTASTYSSTEIKPVQVNEKNNLIKSPTFEVKVEPSQNVTVGNVTVSTHRTAPLNDISVSMSSLSNSTTGYLAGRFIDESHQELEDRSVSVEKKIDELI